MQRHSTIFLPRELFLAIKNGDSKAVRALAASANTTDLASALHLAAYKNQPEVIRTLLEVPGINVNAVTDAGETALHLAVGHYHFKATEALLTADDIDVNATTPNGRTALHIAAAYEDDTLDTPPQAGKTTVNRAIVRGSIEVKLSMIVEALLSRPDIYLNVTDAAGETALDIAARIRHVAVARLLLNELGCTVSATMPTQAKIFCFHVAAQHGLIDKVNLLLGSHGIDVNTATADGVTALHLAAVNGRIDVTRTLIATESINVNAMTTDSVRTHSRHVYSHGDLTDVTDIGIPPRFEWKGIDAYQAPSCGTALHLAALKGQSVVVRALLAAPGIDVNAATSDGVTALHLSVFENINSSHVDVDERIRVVRALIAAPGINVNATTIDGLTALDIAAETQNTPAMRMLLAIPGTTIDVTRSGRAEMYLNIAVRDGHREIARSLLNIPGIDVDTCVMPFYDTPFRAAIASVNHEMTYRLLMAGAERSLSLLPTARAELVLPRLSPDLAIQRMLTLICANLPLPEGPYSTQDIFLLAARGDIKKHAGVIVDSVRAGIISVNEQDERGNTLLHHASVRGCGALVQALLRLGASPYVRNHAGEYATVQDRAIARAPLVGRFFEPAVVSARAGIVTFLALTLKREGEPVRRSQLNRLPSELIDAVLLFAAGINLDGIFPNQQTNDASDSSRVLARATR